MTRETRFRLEAAAFRAVLAIARVCPRGAFVALGRAAGRAWTFLDRKHVEVARDNLARAFPDWPRERVASVAAAVWVHFGGVMFDLVRCIARARGPQDVRALCDIDGGEHARAAHASGRGVVIATAHFGNWEAHGITHAMEYGAIGVVARPLDNPALDAAMRSLREAAGNEVIEKEHAMIRSMRRLKAGGAVAFVVDQNVQEKEAVFIDFFGRTASATPFAAKLAIRAGAFVLPCRAALQPDLRYRVIYDAPIDAREYADDDAGALALTQRIAKITEGWIRETPEQWLWMHRRWHTQPTRNA